MKRRRVTKDFETRSECNLKKAGAYKYSLDPSTKPTCFAFKIYGEPKIYFLDYYAINRHWRDQPQEFRNLWLRLIEEEYEFSAHNSFFEKCIYDNILVKRYGWPRIPPRLRRCTAAKAAACALPRNLEGAGEALKLRVQKDRRGYAAMMATCKPTKQYNAWVKKLIGPPPPMFLEPDTAPEIFQTLYTYCKIDVKAEEAVDRSLPDLVPQEQNIWHLNQMLNWRGLRVDIPTITKVVSMMAEENKIKRRELDTLTSGLVSSPHARKSVLDFLMSEGVVLKNLQAKTVEDRIKEGGLKAETKRLLEIRQALSKTSTKKYQAFLDRAVADRVRDILLYHAASTGRDGGTGIQPHNFPRGLMRVQKGFPYSHVENVSELDPEMIKLVYGDSLGILFSAILRNMIIPSDGCELFVADFAKVEVAVLWWLADNAPGLKVLRDKKDPYKYMAAANANKNYEDITDEGDERQLGKAQVLGCGFGMGPSKFQKTAWDLYRLKLTEEQSKIAVRHYRDANEAVPILWKKYEKAAIEVVRSGGVIKAGKCKFVYDSDKRYGGCKFLWVVLPSGRRLAYADPRLTMRYREFEVKRYLHCRPESLTPEAYFDEEKQQWYYNDVEMRGPYETLEFFAVNSKTKKWGVERTWGGTLAENITQAVARDLMKQGGLRLEKKGYKLLLDVHDEGITEKRIGEGDLEDFTKILCEQPVWGPGLPVDAKGWIGPRYRK